MTIVTACRNRLYNLKKVINSWASIKPKKILIIDFGSDKKITIDQLELKEDADIEIIREENEKWILSWAFNLGLERVNTDFTLKLDCESLIKDDFLVKNKPKRNAFIKGNWRYYKGDKKFFNGSFLSCSKILKEVGYYDERITTYGWDDSDLYERLHDHCYEGSTIAEDSFDILPQNNETRTEHQEVSIEKLLADELKISIDKFLIRRNQKYCKLIEKWSKKKYIKKLKFRAENTLSNNPKLFLATFQTFSEFIFERSYKKSLKTEKLTVKRFNSILKKNYKKSHFSLPNFSELRNSLKEFKISSLNKRNSIKVIYESLINFYNINNYNFSAEFLKNDFSSNKSQK